MADDIRYSEQNIQLIHSIAEKMESQMAVDALTGGAIGGIYNAASFILGILNSLQGDSTVAEALLNLQKQINNLKAITDALNNRLNELEEQVAIESNRDTLRALRDRIQDLNDVALQLGNLTPTATVDSCVNVANSAGLAVDRFLDDDFDVWRWADVVKRKNAEGQMVVQAITGRFKNVPTLPVYILGILTWLAARERAVRLNGRDRLADDSTRLARR